MRSSFFVISVLAAGLLLGSRDATAGPASACLAGSYSATGLEPCSPCDAGTAQPSSGQTGCAPCTAGKFSGPGSAICSNCLAGTYSNAGAPACTNCDPGYYAPSHASSSCLPCGAGTYEPSAGSSMCDECPGGSATPCNDNGACDDGPTGSGSCTCDAGYTGVACENGPPPTTSTSTTLPFDCPDLLLPSCTVGGRTSLQIKYNANPAKNQIKWKFSKGEQVLHEDFGNPSSSTTYKLCIYDSTAASFSVVASLTIAPDGSWTDKDPKGWGFKDSSGEHDGVSGIKLKPGADGKSKAQLKGKGVELPVLTPVAGALFDQDPSVVALLVNSDGLCLASVFTAGDTSKNTAAEFKASAK